MVDTGATSHIVTDITKFKDFDENFKPQKHILELADGVRSSSEQEQFAQSRNTEPDKI